MFYLNWVNKFLNNEYYKEQQINQKILDVLSKNQSFNMMFNLNIILKQHQYFLDKFAQEMVDEEVAGILKGSTFLQNLDEEMKKHGTKSYFVNNYKINSLLKTLNKNKWYWVDDDNYPIDEIDNNELISMILDYLEAS
ncbi:hypothetical protein NPA08_04290 [Mycoplasmopsis citelli]|nr:hypothetical protein [Mycoplasmopsis citelli]UUD36139.1 hypothetical protein NPA08_04290 [Mycoplasmopsis citelli]